jgi:hypothetical protein
MSMTNEHKFEDPKIQLILSIKEHDEKITFFLENNRYKDAGKSIHFLLGRLEITDSEEDKKIKDLKTKISVQNYHLLTIDDLDYAFTVIHDFLNRTYYKGFSNNRPPTRERSMKDLQMTVDTAKYGESE